MYLEDKRIKIKDKRIKIKDKRIKIKVWANLKVTNLLVLKSHY